MWKCEGRYLQHLNRFDPLVCIVRDPNFFTSVLIASYHVLVWAGTVTYSSVCFSNFSLKFPCFYKIKQMAMWIKMLLYKIFVSVLLRIQLSFFFFPSFLVISTAQKICQEGDICTGLYFTNVKCRISLFSHYIKDCSKNNYLSVSFNDIATPRQTSITLANKMWEIWKCLKFSNFLILLQISK